MHSCRLRAASERRGGNLQRFYGPLPERQGQNLALTVLYVPDSLDMPVDILVTVSRQEIDALLQVMSITQVASRLIRPTVGHT